MQKLTDGIIQKVFTKHTHKFTNDNAISLNDLYTELIIEIENVLMFHLADSNYWKIKERLIGDNQ